MGTARYYLRPRGRFGLVIVVQDQNDLQEQEQLPLEASYSQFRSMRMKPAWIANTCPHSLFEISQLAQVTEEIFLQKSKRTLKRSNKAVAFAIDNSIPLRIEKLNQESLRVRGFADAPFANNADLSTQLGNVCFIGDDTGAVVPISFKSYKSRRVTRSSMAGEVIAFSDLLDVAAVLTAELQALTGAKVPVQLLTDSNSLFDVISKGFTTSKKIMLLDITAAREGFRDKVTSDIGYVRSASNIADRLKKPMQQRSLQDMMLSGRLDVTPEQWIVRN